MEMMVNCRNDYVNEENERCHITLIVIGYIALLASYRRCHSVNWTAQKRREGGRRNQELKMEKFEKEEQRKYQRGRKARNENWGRALGKRGIFDGWPLIYRSI